MNSEDNWGKGLIKMPITGDGYPFGVLATPKEEGGARYEELHGPFASFSAAQEHIRRLRGVYSDYADFRVVKLETPAVSQ